MSADKYNVTYSGECSNCGCVTTVTGYGSTELPPGPLGYEATDAIPCMLDSTPVVVRLVAICLPPFEASVPDEEDDPEDAFEDAAS